MSTRPPLPENDDELEEIMRLHLEPMGPAPELALKTREAMRLALERRARPGRHGPLLLLVGLAATAIGVGLGRGAAPPPRPDDPAPAQPPAPAPAPAPAEQQPPAPEPELILELGAKPEEMSADEDYNQLHHLLRADVVLVGAVTAATADGQGGSLRVKQVLRGDRRALARIAAGPTPTGCEGIPDFRPLVAQEVVVFLTKRPDGSLVLLHGAAGLQRLPYLGKLPLDALTPLVQGQPIPGERLAALVQQDPALLGWLNQQTRADHAGAPEVQKELVAALSRIEQLSRPAVMSIVRGLAPPKSLPAGVLEDLRAYHTSFLDRKLNAWSQEGGFMNTAEDHAAFMSFVLPHDPAWVKQQLAAVREAVEAGEQPAAALGAYAELEGRLR